MKYLLIASVFALFLFPSCQDQHTHASGSDAVALNNGQRWEANPETTIGISNMQKILNNTQGDETDFLQLHANLEGAFQTIFQQCTMTGEAHDRLHDYLMPIKDHLNSLLSVAPGEEQKVIDNFSEYLSTYKNYFTSAGM